MNSQVKYPETLIEAVKYFSDFDTCHDTLIAHRWPDGVHCVHCDSGKVTYLPTRRKFQCRDCRKSFSVRYNTVFEDSPLGLDKWLVALWVIVSAKNGVSSYEISRALGITQKSAWFMMHRLRLVLQDEYDGGKLSGEVEVDESYIGGKARNMHKGKRKAKGTGMVGKTIVMGILERHGEVRTELIPNPRRKTVQPIVHRHVKKGSKVHTDALASYNGLSRDFVHHVIDHAEAYAKGNVHTNGLENFWSLLKRGLKGTYVSVEPFHLFRYLDEQAFRYNNRRATDRERFDAAMKSIAGKRLTYDRLIGECVS